MGDLLAGTPGRQELALAYLAWAREHFEGRPGVAALWTREARVRLGMGEPAAAARAWAEVARLEPDARDTHLLHAQVLRARGEGPEALRLLEQLLSRFPADVELAFTLASWQLDAGLTRRAKATLEAVSPFLTNYSQRARLFALEAVCLEREGLYSLAAERLQSAARLAPGPDAWFALARMQEKLRRYDAAARSVHEGLRLLPPEARKDALAWVARLEAAERERVDTRRQELTDDPHAREAEQLLRGGSGKAQDAP
jgi:tetratricopeptide (TPR) repeat protein